MKGLLVLLSMLAVLAAAGAIIGYAVFGKDFYDIITVAEARLKAAEREAQELGLIDGSTEDGQAENAPPADGSSGPPSEVASTPAGDANAGGGLPPLPGDASVPSNQQPAAQQPTAPPPAQVAVVTPPAASTAQQAVTFTDTDQLFSSVFPAPVSRFEDFVQGIDPEMVAESVTYAAAGAEIIAQVSRLRWQDEFAPVIPPFLDAVRRDPVPALASELGQRMVAVLMGEGTRIDQVRRFDAFGRDAVELTGAIPDGDQGGHYAVIWLMPDGDHLILVVLRAYDNTGLLGAEAAQFNQSFQLLREVAAVSPQVEEAVEPAPSEETGATPEAAAEPAEQAEPKPAKAKE
ncbi:MAG: hypothetical protein KI792_14340 [Alphaproteobacteria bacterium]|nr:hypothetical protein [Alphaproteobacteria bacterium SS10]